MNVNWWNVVVIVIVAVTFVFALRFTIEQKGKCAYCDNKNTCPYKNIKECKK